MKDNFGNVVIDSIEQANTINRCGIYKVGRYAESDNQQFKVGFDKTGEDSFLFCVHCIASDLH